MLTKRKLVLTNLPWVGPLHLFQILRFGTQFTAALRLPLKVRWLLTKMSKKTRPASIIRKNADWWENGGNQ